MWPSPLPTGCVPTATVDTRTHTQHQVLSIRKPWIYATVSWLQWMCVVTGSGFSLLTRQAQRFLVNHLPAIEHSSCLSSTHKHMPSLSTMHLWSEACWQHYNYEPLCRWKIPSQQPQHRIFLGWYIFMNFSWPPKRLNLWRPQDKVNS